MHKNFSFRTLSEYYISPGIKCKFDILKEHLGSRKKFEKGIDLGCSGNSFLYFLDNVVHKSFFDIASLPLVQYFKIQSKESNVKKYKCFLHPLCGDLTKMPYREETFDFVSALDVLEHIKDDNLAVSEISRILKRNGIAIIVVPHIMRYYNRQDKLIGHYRRYEFEHIVSLFDSFNLKCLQSFGIYGSLMKISCIQISNPKKIETSIIDLRNRYESNPVFRKLWNAVVVVCSKAMKIDAKLQPTKRIRNIGLLFVKK